MLFEPRVLIVEDDADQAHIFAESVRLAKATPVVAQDGAQARARLQEFVPSAVILDLHLPGVSGLELLRQIRSEARLAGTPVIVTSADARAAAALHDQADFVFVKPVGFKQLSQLVMRLHRT